MKAGATLTADELAVVQVHMHLPIIREPWHDPERQRRLRVDARAEDTRRVHCDTAHERMRTSAAEWQCPLQAVVMCSPPEMPTETFSAAPMPNPPSRTQRQERP